jgi:hypothetical protein
VLKLGGAGDRFIAFRTAHYKAHYYETPTRLKFVMLTDPRMAGLSVVLHQIYVTLYVEYVVKNPLAPIGQRRRRRRHASNATDGDGGGDGGGGWGGGWADEYVGAGSGVGNELFELALDRFISGGL